MFFILVIFIQFSICFPLFVIFLSFHKIVSHCKFRNVQLDIFLSLLHRAIVFNLINVLQTHIIDKAQNVSHNMIICLYNEGHMSERGFSDKWAEMSIGEGGLVCAHM